MPGKTRLVSGRELGITLPGHLKCSTLSLLSHEKPQLLLTIDRAGDGLGILEIVYYPSPRLQPLSLASPVSANTLKPLFPFSHVYLILL